MRLDPYELVAAFYEAEHSDDDADVAFFARHGEGGRLLVLGCGTGRISAALASEREVVGLDRSEAMLRIARPKAPGAEHVLGDMRSFDLGQFQEIIIPNAGFNFLRSRADQAACLRSCVRALAPGGLLTLDLPMPAFHLWDRRHSPEVHEWSGEVDGITVVRTRETHREVERQHLDLVDRYYIEGALVATASLELRIVMPSEAEWMVEAHGAWVEEVLGDYSGGRIEARSERVIVRARPL